ncbi:unnamed protein product [Protopolystoma xenopodis]|uniref:RNA polymerase III subunit C6 n=1 Tax=Protopolystoma xenopodis TaxID=117903 RepID=A0A448XAB0_9PLAT|nr:unnamed protein product [Protopolystoma xenopodis]
MTDVLDHESHALRSRVLNLFNQADGMLTQKHFVNEFKDVSLTEILPILNSLQKEGLLDVLVNHDRTLSWKLRDECDINKIKQLSDIEEILVYNAIRKTGEDGATLRVIGHESKIPQNKISRILKSLITKAFIKELPTASGQKQKVYLLYDVNPSKKLAATTLFAGENGVDVEFISMLRAAVLKYFRDKV